MNEDGLSGIPVPGERIGSWRVVRELGRGGMATVHEVEHLETGERCALKLLRPGARSPEELLRFRREFRALRRLRHPNIARFVEAGVHAGDRPYFVMELLEGRDLKEEIETWRGLPAAERARRADAVLVQVARALEYVHSLGIVHRDVTPSNLLLGPDGVVRLTDFGVVKLPGADLTTVGEVVGTIAYIAPEQVLGGEVDARADLYALGALYYLMLTGRRPFNARTVAGYLDKHVHRPVRPPRELDPNLPEHADHICVRLLAKDPDDRFASATHLRLVLEREVHAPDPLEEALNHPRLVGRTRELAALREALARLLPDEDSGRPGRGGVIVIQGVPGMGRGRMAGELVRLAMSMGVPATLVRNRAPDQRAFEGFRALYEELRGTTDPLPALRAVFGDGGDEPDRWAVLDAMRRLVRATGPRLVVLVDPERADRGTIEMLDYLVRNAVGTDGRPLLFALVRATPSGDDPLAEIVDGRSTGVPAEVVELRPLTPAAVEELLLHVVEPSAAVRPLAERIRAASEGVPFLVNEMVRGLIERGVIRPRAPGRRGALAVEPDALDDLTLPVPRPVRDAVRSWLAPLSADARAVAEALAVAREDLDPELLGEVAGIEDDRLDTAIEELLEHGLVRARQVGAEERLELARNRLRDVLLEELDAERRRLLHRRVGEAIERAWRRSTATVVELLAHHFDRGGVPAKALPYLVQSADKLFRRGFIAEAMRLLDRATEIEPEARRYVPVAEADRRRAELGLLRSRVLFHLGRWVPAEREGREAYTLASELEDARLLAAIETERACQARRALRLEEAERLLRTALRHAEETGDPRLKYEPLYELGAVCWSRGDLDGARRYFQDSLGGAASAGDERSLALGYNGLGLIALCRGQSAEARRHFERAIAVSERHGLMERLAVARTNLVEVHHLCGNLRKGLELADRAVAHAREVRHLYGIGLALRYRVMMLTDTGRLAEAEADAREALAIQRGLENCEEELACLIVLARALLAGDRLGEAEEAVASALALVDDYDTEGFAPVLHAWAARLHARAGRGAEARAALERARHPEGRRWPFQEARRLVNVARVHALLEEPEPAMEALREVLSISDRCGYRFYAMKAHQVAAHLAPDPALAARHARVARALERSLSANLPAEQAEVFRRIHGGG